MADTAERVLFVDTDGTLAAVAVAALSDVAPDAYEGTAAAVEMPDGAVSDEVTDAADVDATGFTHVVTMTSAAKADCPMVTPGTHYLHWHLDDVAGEAGEGGDGGEGGAGGDTGEDDDAVRLAVGDRVRKAFAGQKTYTPVGDLPAQWGEEE